jgi:hypothetical protein
MAWLKILTDGRLDLVDYVLTLVMKKIKSEKTITLSMHCTSYREELCVWLAPCEQLENSRQWHEHVLICWVHTCPCELESSCLLSHHA